MKSYTNQDFNPSNDTRVDEIKAAAQKLAEAIVTHCPEGPLADKALIDTQSASMFAVKSLFT